MSYVIVGEDGGGGAPMVRMEHQAVSFTADSKAPLEILMRLQMWISTEFKNLSTSILSDANSDQYLRIMKTSPHPVLITQPSTELICRVDKDMHVNCELQAFNSIVIKQVAASLEEEYEDLKCLLTVINGNQTSICKGIPEEKLVTWASRKNLSSILIERFLNKVVFRERSCSYVILETDQADICRSCALLLSSSSMDLHGDNELECPEPDCERSFKYQGALEKHIQKHNEDDAFDEHPKKMKKEEAESLNHIKLEPEAASSNVGDVTNGAKSPTTAPDDADFLDRLLDDLEYPVKEEPMKKQRRKKKFKPATKDFSCSDCGKDFYFQKNLFTHVVEKHGKSVDELPNLSLVKTEDGIIKRRKKRSKKGEKGPSVNCEECGVTFKFASGLYNHRKRMHGNTEKIPCPHCDRPIKSCTLDQHIREEHGTPRYACQFCGKGFYYKSFMLNHQRLHTGEFKECICDLCGAVYKSVQVLNRHVRNAHQDLRNHKCDHCEKAFHNKQRLDRHINSQHTKSKLWPCPVCNSKYDRKDNLRTHIRKNHSGVINLDTVELNPIENDGGFEFGGTAAAKKHRPPPTASSQILTQALLMSGNADRVEPVGGSDRDQFIGPDRSPPPLHAAVASGGGQERNVHGAQDLLHLKYSEETHFRTTQEQIKREELSQLQQLRIPFETAIMRHEQDYGRIVQREEYLRSKQLDREVEADIRLSVNSPPPPREHSIAAANARDVMQVTRDNGASPAHSLAQTIHHIQNGYAFNGLQGPPL